MNELPSANRSYIFHAAQLMLRARDVFTALCQKADLAGDERTFLGQVILTSPTSSI